MAQTIDRTKPPETPPIPTYKMPPIYETQLPNGLAVVLIEDQRFPLVTVRLSFQAGSKFDPKELPGLSGMVAGLLTQGTKTRSFREIGEELASIGGSLNGHSSPDVLTIGGNVLAENTPKLFDLLADVALNASFPENEVQLQKQNRKQGLLAQHSQPAFLANEKFDELVFGDHPYHYIAPTAESIDRMDQKSMIEFRDSHLAPNNAVLILLGKLPPRNETMNLVREKFGSWKEKPAPAAPARNFPESKRQLVLVDRPGSVQADIHIGQLAVTRTDPDYFPCSWETPSWAAAPARVCSTTSGRRKDSLTTCTANSIAVKMRASRWPSRRFATTWSSRPWKRCSDTWPRWATRP